MEVKQIEASDLSEMLEKIAETIRDESRDPIVEEAKKKVRAYLGRIDDLPLRRRVAALTDKIGEVVNAYAQGAEEYGLEPREILERVIPLALEVAAKTNEAALEVLIKVTDRKAKRSRTEP